ERCVWPLSAWPQFAINFIADIKMLEELSSGSTFYCISPGNKKPAKPYDLRVFRVLCTALNQCLVEGRNRIFIYNIENKQYYFIRPQCYCKSYCMMSPPPSQ
ncbi:MAG: hypothetical protein ACXWT1_15975, partial [Methylobacter sp.]